MDGVQKIEVNPGFYPFVLDIARTCIQYGHFVVGVLQYRPPITMTLSFRTRLVFYCVCYCLQGTCIADELVLGAGMETEAQRLENYRGCP